MSTATPAITVLYFAAASTVTGITEETIPLPDNSTPLPLSALPALLVERHPGVGLENILKGSRWSVDAAMIDEDEEGVVLKGGEEVAVICPVSGG